MITRTIKYSSTKNSIDNIELKNDILRKQKPVSIKLNFKRLEFLFLNKDFEKSFYSFYARNMITYFLIYALSVIITGNILCLLISSDMSLYGNECIFENTLYYNIITGYAIIIWLFLFIFGLCLILFLLIRKPKRTKFNLVVTIFIISTIITHLDFNLYFGTLLVLLIVLFIFIISLVFKYYSNTYYNSVLDNNILLINTFIDTINNLLEIVFMDCSLNSCISRVHVILMFIGMAMFIINNFSETQSLSVLDKVRKIYSNLKDDFLSKIVVIIAILFLISLICNGLGIVIVKENYFLYYLTILCRIIFIKSVFSFILFFTIKDNLFSYSFMSLSPLILLCIVPVSYLYFFHFLPIILNLPFILSNHFIYLYNYIIGFYNSFKSVDWNIILLVLIKLFGTMLNYLEILFYRRFRWGEALMKFSDCKLGLVYKSSNYSYNNYTEPLKTQRTDWISKTNHWNIWKVMPKATAFKPEVVVDKAKHIDLSISIKFKELFEFLNVNKISQLIHLLCNKNISVTLKLNDYCVRLNSEKETAPIIQLYKNENISENNLCDNKNNRGDYGFLNKYIYAINPLFSSNAHFQNNLIVMSGYQQNMPNVNYVNNVENIYQQNIYMEDQDINMEDQDINMEDQDVNMEGQDVDSEGSESMDELPLEVETIYPCIVVERYENELVPNHLLNISFDISKLQGVNKLQYLSEILIQSRNLLDDSYKNSASLLNIHANLGHIKILDDTIYEAFKEYYPNETYNNQNFAITNENFINKLQGLDFDPIECNTQAIDDDSVQFEDDDSVQFEEDNSVQFEDDDSVQFVEEHSVQFVEENVVEHEEETHVNRIMDMHSATITQEDLNVSNHRHLAEKILYQYNNMTGKRITPNRLIYDERETKKLFVSLLGSLLTETKSPLTASISTILSHLPEIPKDSNSEDYFIKCEDLEKANRGQLISKIEYQVSIIKRVPRKVIAAQYISCWSYKSEVLFSSLVEDLLKKTHSKNKYSNYPISKLLIELRQED